MCPRKGITEPKLFILVSFFSGEVTSYTTIPVIASTYCRKHAVPFLLGHPVYIALEEAVRFQKCHDNIMKIENDFLKMVMNNDLRNPFQLLVAMSMRLNMFRKAVRCLYIVI